MYHGIMYNRLKAVLALRGVPVGDFCAQAEVSLAHLGYVIDGKREASAALLARIEALFTAQEWAFIQGRSDTLTAARGAVASPRRKGKK